MGRYIEYMHRMGELEMQPSVSLMCRRLLDVLQLTRFSCWSTDTPDSLLPVPAHWAHPIELCSCASGFLVAFRLLGALRTYSGRVLEGRGFGGPIAACFPSLELLRIDNVTQAGVDSLTPFPRSLASLTVHTATNVNCSLLLDGNSTHIVRQLDIRSHGTAASVFKAFWAFTSTVDGSWTLQVTDNVIQLRAPQSRYETKCTESSWLSRVPGVTSFWGGPRELHLPLSDYLQILGSGTPGRVLAVVLPALALAGFVFGAGDNPRHVFPDSVCISAPSLQCIVLAINRELNAVNTVVARILRSFVGRTRILGDLVVVTDYPNALGHVHFTALGRLVARV